MPERFQKPRDEDDELLESFEGARDDELLLDSQVELLKQLLEDQWPVFEHLAEQIAEDISYQQWDVVIGDDASGRLPALFVGELVRRWRHDAGLQPPTRIFIGGGRVAGEAFAQAQSELFLDRDEYDTISDDIGKKSDQVADTLAYQVPPDADRALLVTEHIEFGHTLGRIVAACERYGMGVDIVTFNAYDSEPVVLDRLERSSGVQLDGSHVYVGKEVRANEVAFKPDRLTKEAVALYRSYGVTRPDDGKVGTELDPDAIPSLVRVARQTIQSMAEECYALYFAQDTDEDLDDESFPAEHDSYTPAHDHIDSGDSTRGFVPVDRS